MIYYIYLSIIIFRSNLITFLVKLSMNNEIDSVTYLDHAYSYDALRDRDTTKEV